MEGIGPVIEWSEANKYNSFSSYKGLAYFQHYQKIVGWLDSKNDLPPPIECNLDPIAECNLECGFCITQRYLRTYRDEVGPMRRLPDDYMLYLVDFLADWGVEGLCLSGGGEPTLHTGLPQAVKRAVSRGMKTSVFTNGTCLSDEIGEALLLCQWVALSIDAADQTTYHKIKGRSLFPLVIRNIERFVAWRKQNKSDVALCFKFLLLPENAATVYQACKLAKSLGVQDFHARPPDLERADVKGKAPEFDLQRLQEDLGRCHEEETKDFHVYTVSHKFSPDLHVAHNFNRCLASPLVIPILTDGNAYLCVDRKMEKAFKLGSCFPQPRNILQWWGSDKHRELIKSIDISKCSRCTWGEYNRQIEETVLEDKMCLAFP